MAISVNMLRLRVITDWTPRTKNGQPAHSTTGVASRSWIQPDRRGSMRWPRPRWAPISRTTTGTVSARPIQKRRVMSTSSGLGPVSAVMTAGSSPMPQIGQVPGPIWRISGCIGQVYSVPSGTGSAGWASGFRKRSGSATNFVRQWPAAEVIGLALVVGLVLGGRRIDVHAADEILDHALAPAAAP